jgi:hypothetical protein
MSETTGQSGEMTQADAESLAGKLQQLSTTLSAGERQALALLLERATTPPAEAEGDVEGFSISPWGTWNWWQMIFSPGKLIQDGGAYYKPRF